MVFNMNSRRKLQNRGSAVCCKTPNVTFEAKDA
jgi:hypothetical protein